MSVVVSGSRKSAQIRSFYQNQPTSHADRLHHTHLILGHGCIIYRLLDSSHDSRRPQGLRILHQRRLRIFHALPNRRKPLPTPRWTPRRHQLENCCISFTYSHFHPGAWNRCRHAFGLTHCRLHSHHHSRPSNPLDCNFALIHRKDCCWLYLTKFDKAASAPGPKFWSDLIPARILNDQPLRGHDVNM